MLAEPYFALPPPKSTGREYFNADWLLKDTANHETPAQSIQATPRVGNRGSSPRMRGTLFIYLSVIRIKIKLPEFHQHIFSKIRHLFLTKFSVFLKSFTFAHRRVKRNQFQSVKLYRHTPVLTQRKKIKPALSIGFPHHDGISIFDSLIHLGPNHFP
jgi:hypothetical protein